MKTTGKTVAGKTVRVREAAPKTRPKAAPKAAPKTPGKGEGEA